MSVKTPTRPRLILDPALVKSVEEALKFSAEAHCRWAVKAAKGAQSELALKFSADHLKDATDNVIALAREVWGIRPGVTLEP